jgi:hypothetical protein
MRAPRTYRPKVSAGNEAEQALGRARDFYRGVVRPTVDEAFRDHRDIRRVRLAAIVLYHMADYWLLTAQGGAATPRRDELPNLHKELIARCPDFRLVRDIADASKHATLGVQKEIPRVLSGSDQLWRSPGIFEAPFGQGVFNEASIVECTLDDGTTRPVLGVIRSVADMWAVMVEPPAV